MHRFAKVWAKQTSRQIKNLNTFVRQWPERTRALHSYVAWLSATYVLSDMLDRLPKTEALRPYRMGLEVARVSGTNAFAIHLDSRNRRVKKADVQKAVIVVQPSRRQRRPRADIQVLAEYGPWTYDTIPFMPAKRDATVIVRKADRSEVMRVSRARQKQARIVRVALNKSGKRYVRKRDKLKLNKRLNKVPQVIFEALKLEFGLGADKARPHWRPSIQMLIRSGVRQFKRTNPEIAHTLTRESFREWRKWPPRTRHIAKASDTKLWRNFQKKLGIRVS